MRRINEDRAGAAFDVWRRANPEASETERLNEAVDLALAYGAAPAALKTAVLRRVKDRLGVRRARHGRMTVADPDATWEVYAALGRLYRRDPETAKALFPGIHGFVAESVAQNRFGWDAAESDPAARAAILKAIYSDAQRRSFRKHGHGLHALPIVGNILAAPQTAEDIGNVFRRAREGDPGRALESLVQAALGVGLPAGRVAGKAAGGPKKKPADARTAQGTPDPDLHGAGIDWSGRESTQRFFREVFRSRRWRARFSRKVPTVGAPEYKGQPIEVGGGRPDVLVGEARLHWDGKQAYALNLQGERVYIDRLPRNAVRKKDGGWLVTRRLDDGSKVTVYYNPYGVPEFPARGAFWLPPETIKRGRNAHREYVRKRLQDMAEANSEELGKMGFTAKQIERMKNKVDLRELGIEIHHDYRVGRLVIVDRRFHKFAHKGGLSLW